MSADAPTDSWVLDFPLHIHALGPGKSFYQYSAAIVPWLLQHASQYDVILVRGLWRYISFAVWRALRNQAVPYFVFTHGMLDPWFKLHYPFKHLKKLLYWRWGEYRVLRDANAVLFTTEEERLLARKSFRPYSCKEVVVRYGTANPDIDLPSAKESFFAEHPQLRSKRIFLFLGRIHEKKGCDLLIKAFSKFAKNQENLQLVFAGPDQVGLQSKLEQLAKTQNIAEHVTWLGPLHGGRKWAALAAAEAFILPSHQENFGIAVVEALAVGTPVLISNKVNIWREVLEDQIGFVEKDDLSGTERLLRNWLALSAPETEKMSAQARQSFLKRFEIHALAEDLLRQFELAHGKTR